MPANLTPQYLEADKRFRQARTTEEKIRCLEEMLAVIPKHKGTDHLQGDLKRRLSKLKAISQQKSATGRRSHPRVERDGAGQVVIIGPPNAGKSTLLSCLTNASPEIGNYPFTTHGLNPGMMPFENIKIQLVDTPPVTEEYMDYWMPEVVRNTDLAMLVLDLSAPELLEIGEAVVERLAKNRLYLCANESVERQDEFGVYRKTLVLANKADVDPEGVLLGMLEEVMGDHFRIIPVSCLKETGLEMLPGEIFRSLGIVRIYSKQPGKKPDREDPFILKKGGTVLDMAADIHKDFAERFKFARLWGSGKYDGQMINRDYVLQDEDVVEIHMQ